MRVCAFLASVFLLVGCGGGSKAQPGPVLPAPNERLPRDPTALAGRVAQVNDALNGSIDAWLRDGDPSRGAPPEPVTLQALYVQRAYRMLARHPRLASRTLRLLPARVRGGARDATAALRDLMRLTPPPKRHRRLKTGPPRPAGQLLGFYRTGQRRFGVAWNVLAAVNFVETAFGRVRSSSSSGAQGPMQFLPATWRRYGMGGDVHDPHDAVLGAANYLHRSGAPGSYRRALYAYNPSPLYVDAVLRYARRMARERNGYFAFYAWQVFIHTRSGDRRLTGP